jgi:hypothetical protein
MPPSRLLVGLRIGALGLPIVLCVLMAAARLLEGMQDAPGAAALARISLACYILWAIDLIGLIIVQAMHALAGSDRKDDELE